MFLGKTIVFEFPPCPQCQPDCSECGQQILWLDQLTADDKCGALAAWEGLKHWLPCKQKVNSHQQSSTISLNTYLQVNFVCVPSASASLNKTFSYLLVWILYRWIIFP